MVLDHTQDLTGSETHRLTSIYAPPDFVKVASRERLYGDPETQPSHVYGHPTQRLFPAHTAPATWMSTLFFLDKQASIDPRVAAIIEQRLQKAADFFGIAGDIGRLKTAMHKDEGNELARLPDSMFALVWTTADAKERHYPLRGPTEVKMAADWFSKYRDEFIFSDRQQIADKILTKAAEYGAAVSDPALLHKAAGRGTCGSSDIVELLVKRATLTIRTHPEHAKELRALAQEVQKAPLTADDLSTRYKLASVLDQFDRQTHLNRQYQTGLERPEDVLFQITEKVASDFLAEHISTTTGNIYEKSALERLSLGQVREWMGNEMADAVSAGGLYVDTEKLADVVTTLPRGDAEMFDRLAAAAGIQPFALDKAAAVEGPDAEEITALAAQYREGATAAIPL